MLFQSLDNKRECYKIYCDGKLLEDYYDRGLTHTWSPSLHFKNKNIEYAKIWCLGKSLSDICPEHLRALWADVNGRAKVFLRTFHSAKINLDDVCFYDLVPEKFLLDFCEAKNQITDFVFKNYERPKNYNFLRNLTFFLKKIEERKLNLDFGNFNHVKKQLRGNLLKIKNCKPNIVYDPWKTVTGRLTTERGSFPILTLNKELRGCLKPRNDVFVELDFNAAELRVLFGLLSQQQPEGDVHTWINENIFDGKLDREKTKKKVFSWLYNPSAQNKKLNQYLNRSKIYDQYFVDGNVCTPFGRVIEASEDKAVNYLIQSTTSDMLLTSAMNVDKMLEQRKSFVSFCVHDSIVIDLCISEKNLIIDLAEKFSETIFGDLKFNLSMGEDFGSMKKIL